MLARYDINKLLASCDYSNNKFNKEYLNLDESSSTEQLFETFWSHFVWCFQVSHPYKKITNRFTDKIQKVKFSNELHIQAQYLKHLNWYKKILPNNEIDNLYKKQKKILNRQIENEKKIFYSNEIKSADNKTKKTWELVNHKLGRQKNLLQ